MSLAKIVETIKENQNFLLTAHINPDGDAIGAETALALALKQMGKNVVIVNKDETPEDYKFLPGSSEIKSPADIDCPNKEQDVLIVLDCGLFDRVGFLTPADFKLVINIDHHATNNAFGQLNYYRPEASSTSELVFELINELPVEITAPIATCIYTGLLTDTGSFHYDNTNVRSFEIAAQLLRYGAHPADIARSIYENTSFNRIRLMGEGLNTIEVFNGGTIGSLLITQDMLKRNQAKPYDTEDFVNFPRSIKGVFVAVFWRELDKDFYKISLRSKVNVDVAKVASKFGGGGHFHAAGAHLRGELSELKQKVVQEVSRALQELEKQGA
ncbi:MAG: bifunctional oligoribonuclease/PAP phosphatase NrnA [Candidatus Schekmanbacteria bacterium]|nr:bifunctional oligoribonuclease/PAP phosphatase NrnA [Candidatus Schekmanbacteria bacterium]